MKKFYVILIGGLLCTASLQAQEMRNISRQQQNKVVDNTPWYRQVSPAKQVSTDKAQRAVVEKDAEIPVQSQQELQLANVLKALQNSKPEVANAAIKKFSEDRIPYDELDYSKEVTTDGVAVTGKLSEQVEYEDGENTIPLNGSGLSFEAEAGKTYQFTVHYQANSKVLLNSAIVILKDGTLTGVFKNDILWGMNKLDNSNELTVKGFFYCKQDALYRILLYDLFLNELNYSISIDIVHGLYDFLDRTAETITYSNNLQFTTYGIMNDLVTGDRSIEFRADNNCYYAIACKIELAAGNQIKIHSSKEHDSFLLIYMSDGDGGYQFVKNDDDGYKGNFYGNYQRDSYIDFTATEGGVYYIIVTDYSPEISDRYFLTVWNTAEEPFNYFDGIPLYTMLDYSTSIPADGSSKQGSFTKADNLFVDMSQNVVAGKGFSFTIQEGKIYQIVCTYNANESVFIEGGFYIFDDDFAILSTQKGYCNNKTELTVTGNFKGNGNIVHLLLYDHYLNDLDYSITIEEISITLYTELVYQNITVDDDAVSGAFSEWVELPIGDESEFVTGAGISFQAEAGKSYQITVKYQMDTETDMTAGYFILTGETLTGNFDDDIVDFGNGDSSFSKELTVNGLFKTDKEGLFRILLFDFQLNKLKYSVTIKEIILVSYTELDYSQTVAIDGTAVTGILSDLVELTNSSGSELVTGAGVSFLAEAGMNYLITLKFQADENVDIYAGYFILKSETLSGDFYEDIIDWGNLSWDNAKELTLTGTFKCGEGGMFRILLWDNQLNNLNYTITIRKIIPYKELDYSQTVAVDGTAVTGILSDLVELTYGDSSDIVTGAGISFQATAGKSYQISVKFQADLKVEMYAGYFILTEKTLSGNFSNDVVDWGNHNWDQTKELSVGGFFKTDESATYRILLTDYQSNTLNYSITIEELFSYADLDYSREVIVAGDAVTGTLTKKIELNGVSANGAGVSFQTEAGNVYQITVKYQSDMRVDKNAGYFILTGETLTGSFEDDLVDWGKNIWEDSREFTINGFFKTDETSSFRVLLWDEQLNDLTYSISIEKIDFILYTELDYSQDVTADGASVDGKFTQTKVELKNDSSSEYVTGAGISFQAEADKSYQISIKFQADAKVDMYAGYLILTGDALTGDIYKDVVNYGNVRWETAKEMTVNGFFRSDDAGTFRILLYDYQTNTLNYSITVLETVPYFELDYFENEITVNGVEGTGTFLQSMVELTNDSDNYFVTGAGVSFQAEEGKTYQININFKAETDVDMYTGYYILTGEALTEDWFDDIIDQGYQNWAYATENMITGFFKSDETALLRILLFDQNLNRLNYSITIKEKTTTLYTELDYSTTVTVGGEAVSGTFSKIVERPFNWGSEYVNGAGISFQAEAGKKYQISIRYQADELVDLYAGYHILKTGTLTGVYNDDIIDWGSSYDINTKDVTINGFFKPDVGATFRILLWDYQFNDLNYSITITETNIISYTDLDYSQLVSVGGDVVEGTLLKNVELEYNWGSDFISGAGLNFQTEAGKTYQISIKYQADTEVDLEVGYNVLTGEAFTGVYDDDVVDYGNSIWQHAKQVTVTGAFHSELGGMFRILLWDYQLNKLSYTVTIEEISILTLPELLDSSTKTITYSDNMQFTANGITTDIVAGDYQLHFRNDDEFFYTVAYKIALTAGNQIKIHSSKENDSYLLIYKSDGSGGYAYVDSDDDGYGYSADSYLDFTAYVTGVYWLVVTDYNQNSAGRYFLTVWNTPDEPQNGYPGEKEDPIITITVHPASVIVTAGSITGSLSVTATVTEDATLSYQWFSNTTNNNTGGEEVTGETSANFTIPVTLEEGSYYYFCEVRAEGAISVRSDAATITVTAENIVNAQMPLINGHPQGVSYTLNATAAALTVTASVTDGGTLSYQWYSNTDNSTVGGTTVGTNSESFTPPTTTVGTIYYYVDVTNTNNSVNGTKTATATSNIAAIVVNTLVNAVVPTITVHPQSANYKQNDVATALSVTASVTDGGTLSYQWYSNNTNSTNGGTATGTNSASFTPPTETVGTQYYYVVVTNTNNSVDGTKTATVTSNLATITVTAKDITGTENLFAPDLNVYPNPFTYVVRIKGIVESSRVVSLWVTNAAGVLVHSQQISGDNQIIRLEHLPIGLYFFTLEQDGKTKTLRVIKN